MNSVSPSARDPEPTSAEVERENPDYEIELAASELTRPGAVDDWRRRGARPSAFRRWLVPAAFVAVGVGGFIVGSRAVGPVAEPAGDPDDVPVAVHNAGATADAIALPFVESTAFVDDDHWLAALVDGDLVQVDFRSGTVGPLGLVEPQPGSGLASFDGRVAIVADGHVVVVDDVGTSDYFVPADTILPASSPERVWVGRRTQDDDVSDRSEPTGWQLVDVNRRSWSNIVRDSPMEYPMPDLVWGFDSSFFRLELATEPEPLAARPVSVEGTFRAADWERIGTGWPIAVGLRDIIIQRCAREAEGERGDCDLTWYDRATGVDRGDLFTDLAANFDAWYGGVISPDGRFIARLPNDDSPVEITVVATGEVIASGCINTDELAWSETGARLACTTALGFEVSTLTAPRGVWRYRSDQDVNALAWGYRTSAPAS